MDTKFSVAVLSLVLMSESKVPLNSNPIALSAGTNASYIRKILSLLKKAGIIQSHRGTGAYVLNTTPDKLTLLSIYKSVMDNGEIHLLDIHKNSNDQCIVGKHIKLVLESMFNKIEEAFVRQLSIMTLRDCINEIKKTNPIEL